MNKAYVMQWILCFNHSSVTFSQHFHCGSYSSQHVVFRWLDYSTVDVPPGLQVRLVRKHCGSLLSSVGTNKLPAADLLHWVLAEII